MPMQMCPAPFPQRRVEHKHLRLRSLLLSLLGKTQAIANRETKPLLYYICVHVTWYILNLGHILDI